MQLHPEIKDQMEEIDLCVQTATQFIKDNGIEIDNEEYTATKKGLYSHNGFIEFFKAWQFEHGMVHTIDYPEGIVEEDVMSAYRKNYPTMAAIGIIEEAKEFKKLASTIDANHSATIVQCLNYATFFSRIKFLLSLMALKEARRKGAGAKQAERRQSAGQNTRIKVLNAAEKLLADPSQRAACLRVNDKFNVSRLWKAIKDNNPQITIKKSQGTSILRDLIKENHIK